MRGLLTFLLAAAAVDALKLSLLPTSDDIRLGDANQAKLEKIMR